MIEGRNESTKKQLINTLFKEIGRQVNMLEMDIEICIIESPASN